MMVAAEGRADPGGGEMAQIHTGSRPRLVESTRSCHVAAAEGMAAGRGTMTLRLPGRWDELTSREFAALDPQGTVAILPVGAVEQHGPHLPVAVDTCLNEAIVRR
ncbi:MAG: creatininase family protein, partial [Geminicoccaceae bacterium]